MPRGSQWVRAYGVGEITSTGKYRAQRSISKWLRNVCTALRCPVCPRQDAGFERGRRWVREIRARIRARVLRTGYVGCPDPQVVGNSFRPAGLANLACSGPQTLIIVLSICPWRKGRTCRLACGYSATRYLSGAQHERLRGETVTKCASHGYRRASTRRAAHLLPETSFVRVPS